jgi:hypothetical protein
MIVFWDVTQSSVVESYVSEDALPPFSGEIGDYVEVEH